MSPLFLAFIGITIVLSSKSSNSKDNDEPVNEERLQRSTDFFKESDIGLKDFSLKSKNVKTLIGNGLFLSLLSFSDGIKSIHNEILSIDDLMSTGFINSDVCSQLSKSTIFSRLIISSNGYVQRH